MGLKHNWRERRAARDGETEEEEKGGTDEQRHC